MQVWWKCIKYSARYRVNNVSEHTHGRTGQKQYASGHATLGRGTKTASYIDNKKLSVAVTYHGLRSLVGDMCRRQIDSWGDSNTIASRQSWWPWAWWAMSLSSANTHTFFLKNWTKLNYHKIQKPKTQFPVWFSKNWLRQFGDSFSHCLIHNSKTWLSCICFSVLMVHHSLLNNRWSLSAMARETETNKTVIKQ